MSTPFNLAEEQAVKAIATKINELRTFLNKYELPSDISKLEGWYNFLNVARSILGNFNNDLSFIGTLLAKVYLTSRFPGLELDACAKSQSASGLDLDIVTPDGKRIIGEVKTVNPYYPSDFGAAQRDAFVKDFAKLMKAVADYKYLFLTEPRAFEVIQNKYRQRLPSVTVVCLADGKEIVT